jgi:hypothetical protein
LKGTKVTVPKEGIMKTSEKIVGIIVALVFVGCLIFESSMVMAVAHVEPFSACATCGSSGGGGF